MRRAVALLTGLSLAAAFAVRPALGGHLDPFPALAGWTHPAPFPPEDSPGRHGVLLDAPPITWNAPVVAEIDGDPGDGLEVAIGSPAGFVHVFARDGRLLWEARVGPAPCDDPVPVGLMPAVAPIFGDGVPYVVVGYGGYTANGCDGGVAAFEGATGRLAWRFSTREWEASEGYPPEALHAVMGTPAIADTDGDGPMEIAFGAFDRNLYLLDADGTVRWYYHAADTVWSSPLFAQVDADAPLELVAASDITFPDDGGGGFLQAFDTAARWQRRIEYGSGYLWRTPNLGQTPYSSPLVADLLPDEPGEEVAIGSGCFFANPDGSRRGRWVKIFRPRDGAELQTLRFPPGAGCSTSSPAAGDVDDDGRLEIVLLTGDPADAGTDGLSRVVAWDPETPDAKWATVPYDPIQPPLHPAGNFGWAGFRSVTLADLDGNGSLEVAVANSWSVSVLAGRDGSPLTCQSTACGTTLSLFAWGTLTSTPAVGDLDGDGALDVVIGGMHAYSPAADGHPAGGRALLYAWTGFAGRLGSQPGSQPPYDAPWPTFRGRPEVRPLGGGGRVTDLCLALPSASVERLRCRAQQLLEAPPCTLPARVSALVQRGVALADVPENRPPTAAIRQLRKSARTFQRARQAARRLPAPCAATVRASLREMVDVVKALVAQRRASAS